jgi:hypothetical protein
MTLPLALLLPADAAASAAPPWGVAAPAAGALLPVSGDGALRPALTDVGSQLLDPGAILPFSAVLAGLGSRPGGASPAAAGGTQPLPSAVGAGDAARDARPRCGALAASAAQAAVLMPLLQLLQPAWAQGDPAACAQGGTQPEPGGPLIPRDCAPAIAPFSPPSATAAPSLPPPSAELPLPPASAAPSLALLPTTAAPWIPAASAELVAPPARVPEETNAQAATTAVGVAPAPAGTTAPCPMTTAPPLPGAPGATPAASPAPAADVARDASPAHAAPAGGTPPTAGALLAPAASPGVLDRDPTAGLGMAEQDAGHALDAAALARPASPAIAGPPLPLVAPGPGTSQRETLPAATLMLRSALLGQTAPLAPGVAAATTLHAPPAGEEVDADAVALPAPSAWMAAPARVAPVVAAAGSARAPARQAIAPIDADLDGDAAAAAALQGGPRLGAPPSTTAVGAAPGAAANATSDALVRQLADGVVLAGRDALLQSVGAAEARVELDPPHLGPLRVRVTLDAEGGLQVALLARDTVVRDRLRAEVDELSLALSGRGLRLTTVAVHAMGTGGAQGQLDPRMTPREEPTGSGYDGGRGQKRQGDREGEQPAGGRRQDGSGRNVDTQA